MMKFLPKSRSLLMGLSALAFMLAATGCRIKVDKNKEGGDKNVAIDTPVGGLYVNTHQQPADLGLPLYPGATAEKDGEGDKSADVRLGFGSFRLRVKAASYLSNAPKEKIAAYYKNALDRYGIVLECQDYKPIGNVTATREGLTCKNESNIHTSNDSVYELKAGSKSTQHIVSIDKEKNDGQTRFALIALDLPTRQNEDSGELK